MITKKIECTASNAEEFAQLEAAGKLLFEHIETPQTCHRKFCLQLRMGNSGVICGKLSEQGGYSINHNERGVINFVNVTCNVPTKSPIEYDLTVEGTRFLIELPA